MLAGWIFRIFDIAVEEGCIHPADIVTADATGAAKDLRTGIASVITRNGTELPYMYTHIIYWTVEMLLAVLSIETGMTIAILYERRENGDGEYKFSSSSPQTWPVHPDIWFRQVVASKIVRNLLLTLFMEGMLKFSDSIQHPLSEKSESYFPVDLYAAIVNNDCGAFVDGLRSFDNFSHPHDDLKGKQGKQGKS
jgi:hypothetical protein